MARTERNLHKRVILSLSPPLPHSWLEGRNFCIWRFPSVGDRGRVQFRVRGGEREDGGQAGYGTHPKKRGEENERPKKVFLPFSRPR